MRKHADGAALFLLALLTVIFFWKLALTNLIMVGVDIFTYFYPYRFAVDEALRRGQLPLWNPYLFMGVPLLANGQAGVFYPPNWLFAMLAAPQAINASIVLHVALAAAGCYGFGRRVLGLSGAGALLAAGGYAFGGYAGALVEHVNQLQAAAWFPFLLWCANRMRHAPRMRATLAGAGVLALQLLAGHAQVTFISLAGVGLCLAASATADAVAGQNVRALVRERDFWLRWIRQMAGFSPALMLMLAGGAALSAMQLAPMVELSRQSIRGGGMTYREAVAFSLAPNQLLEAFLPTYGLGEPVFSEFVAFVGVAALMLAAIGVRRRGLSQFGLLVLLVTGVALAFGLYDPLYYVLYKLVPGFGLFRVPARWLFLFAFAVAGFAGIGADESARRLRFNIATKRRKAALVVAALGVFVLVGLAATRLLDVPPLPAIGLWLLSAAVTTLVLWRPMPQRLRPWVLTMVVLVELFAATRWLPYNQPTAPEAFSSLRPAIAYLLSEDRSMPWRILSYSDLNWDPGDLKDIEAMFAGQLSPEAIYQYTVAAKTKEIVGPNLAMRYGLQSIDGYDGGILPLARFVGLQSLFLTPQQVNPDGRLRERLRAVPDARWLDLFDVRYLIADKIFDVWVDGIYYDLGLGLTLEAGNTTTWDIETPADFTADGIGVVSYLQSAASLPNDTPVAELSATDSQGRTYRFVLRAGRETAESVYGGAQAAHGQARAVHTLRDNPMANEYHALFPFEQGVRLTALSVRGLLPTGKVVVHGISLVDSATATGKPLTLAQNGRFKLAHSGDVKIYELLDVSGRARVVHQTMVEPDDVRALRQMASADFDPRAQIVLAGGRTLSGNTAPTTATITRYEAEHITLHSDDPAEGYLFLKDTWYPGWRAWVDGQPAVIERADTYFRAIYLPAGRHTVELRFEPDSLRVGALVSGVALALWVGGGVWLAWQKRPG